MIRVAKTEAGLLNQLRQCHDCTSKPFAVYGNGRGICIKHADDYGYIEAFEYEKGHFSLTKGLKAKIKKGKVEWK